MGDTDLVPWDAGTWGSLTTRMYGPAVRASTQSPFGARTRIANVLGLEEKSVRVITPFVGGGFGGKSPTEQGVEAARLAQITGKPVMVIWTRGEEFFFDTFGPAAVVKINSAFDDAGKITHWDYHVYAAGDRSSEVLYDVPNVRMKTSLGRRSGARKSTRSLLGRGVRQARRRTSSPANRRSTSWPPRRRSIRSSSACAMGPTSGCAAC